MPFVNSGFKKIDYRDIIARNAFKPQNLFLTKFFILFFEYPNRRRLIFFQ